jgi:hypothetical protein
MNDLSFDTVGLFRRELRDVRAVVANIDHRTRKLIEPVATIALPAWWRGTLPAS